MGIAGSVEDGYHDDAVRLDAVIDAVTVLLHLRFPDVFERLGDILEVPELTEKSPFLNWIPIQQLQKGLNDAVVEWLPQQMLSLVRLGEPRFVVYSYGQSLKPAAHSIVTASGPFFGMCTNYQITAEVVTRTVVRIEGAPDNPRAVIESFNTLPPE